MDGLLTYWLGLDPTVQTALLGTLAGAVLWAVQRYWTDAPWLPLLGPDSTTQKKRIAAFLFALIPGVAIGLKTGNWQQAVAVALAALTAGQTAKLLADKETEESPTPEDMQSGPADTDTGK